MTYNILIKSDVGLYFKYQGQVGLPEKPYGHEHSLHEKWEDPL